MNIEFSTVQRAKQGDQAAISLIYNTMFVVLVSIANKHEMGSNSEDVAVITLTKVFKNISKKAFDSLAHFTNWVYKIHHRSIIDYARKMQKSAVVKSVDMMPELPDRLPHPDKLCASTENMENFWKWVKNDNPKIYQILRMLFEGETRAEISRKLGIPQPTITGRLRKARPHIYAYLNS